MSTARRFYIIILTILYTCSIIAYNYAVVFDLCGYNNLFDRIEVHTSSSGRSHAWYNSYRGLPSSSTVAYTRYTVQAVLLVLAKLTLVFALLGKHFVFLGSVQTTWITRRSVVRSRRPAQWTKQTQQNIPVSAMLVTVVMLFYSVGQNLN